MAIRTDLAPVRDLLSSQRSAVLATQGEDGPYTSLMVIHPSDDLNSILIATPRATRKYVNIKSRPDVALLVDDRSNSGSDVQRAKALTILGQAEEVQNPEREALAYTFSLNHPELTEFLNMPDTALLRIRVRRYILIERFQSATTFEMQP
jgi:heme iron utilization protein